RAGTVVLPRLAAVRAAHQAAQLDAGEQQARVVRIRRDPAHMGGPRPRREAPRGRRGEPTQRIQLPPARSAVVAPEDHARLGAGVDRAVGWTDGEGEDVAGGEIGAAPGGPAVVAPPDAASPGAGEDPARLAWMDGDAPEPPVLGEGRKRAGEGIAA